MEVNYLLVLILFFACSTILLISSHNVSRAATFRVLHQHPGIRNCAADVLKQNDLVGGRVSNVTGVCEGLQRSWTLNQTMQNGYSYLKKSHVKQKYHPPIGINEFPYAPSMLIPGLLHEGAEVQVTIWNDWFSSYPLISVKLTDLTYRRPSVYVLGDLSGHVLSWNMYNHEFAMYERDLNTTYKKLGVSTTVTMEHPEVKKRKLTLRAMTDGFECLFDGKVILTYQRENFDPKVMRQIYVQYEPGSVKTYPVTVHSFEFREHAEG